MISPRRIRTIFRKDLRDAIRDARVLVALLVPLGVGFFYNFTFDEEAGKIVANVVFYSVDQTALPSHLITVAGDVVEVRFFEASGEDEVQRALRDERADLGLIVPAGFDAAIQRDERPRLEILQPASTTIGGDFVTAAIEPALRLMAGQSAPAELEVSAAATPTEAETALDKVGIRNWAILASVTMMIGMIAMLAIPVVLAEESEKRTLDALVLVSSYREVVAAKAALGMFYVVVMVPMLLALTKIVPDKLPLFSATVLLLSATLIGFGLLMAGLFKSANQLNTWSGFLLLPVIGPAFAIGLPTPDTVRRIAELTPTGAGTKLLMNSVTAERVFSNDATMFAVIAAWGAVAFGLLFWQLSRRQA